MEQRKPNRLVGEKSPYLLQHARNPVAWLPWGEEAFAMARSLDRPIFLSVGYATCHWCHVMERESFEDEETAELLNRLFVPVKVDREEHPDLDRLYMLFVQASTGRGGWPMSVWLTPDLKPFYGGSYFPPADSYGMPAFRTVLTALGRLWQEERSRLLDAAGSMMEQVLSSVTRKPGGGMPGREAPLRCAETFERSFDPESGGFGEAPKFPRPVILNFLLDHAWRTGNSRSLGMALSTIRHMARGGIHDHLAVPGRGGGGFSRYSTDRAWHVPHFEKMLYDNAQIALSCLGALQLDRDPLFASLARDIFGYVLHDLASPEGGFCSAEDADSPDAEGGKKREGAFYLWTRREVIELLGTEDGELFCEAYGVLEGGNAVQDPHGEFAGRNILMQAAAPGQLATLYGTGEKDVRTRLDAARALLFEARTGRPRPFLDDKVLTSWNGLMISALAKGYRVLHDRQYLDAATCTAGFILDRLQNRESGRLWRRYRDGEAAIPGKADDYACLVQGLLDLYEASFDLRWLDAAIRLARTQLQLFFDPQDGGFFATPFDDDSVPVRLKDGYDGAEPAASSVSVLNCLRLAVMTGDEAFGRAAEKTLRFFGDTLESNGAAMPQMMVALHFALYPKVEVVFAGDPEECAMTALRHAACLPFRPDGVFMHASEESARLLPHAATLARRHRGKPAAYVCAGRSCKPPVYEPEQLAEMLERREP
jgi:uncharacterized protein YyaL (SSP411 family)